MQVTTLQKPLFLYRRNTPKPLYRSPRRQCTVVKCAAKAQEAISRFGKAEEKLLESIKVGDMGDEPDQELVWRVGNAPLDMLTDAACTVRDRRPNSHIVTFSPKVFIPLTRACRDKCSYCTFAVTPSPGQNVYMTPDEVLRVARRGAEIGCTEALFTLGDKPELVYPSAMDQLRSIGHTSTVSYVGEMAKLVLNETGLLPHVNAGVLSESEIQKLRQVSISQGLMLESISERLLQNGGPHFDCPDKVPDIRIKMIASAGRQKVPFTSGLLIGIGETREEILKGLFSLRSLHKQYGHIQEIIIQNFCAKKGTKMADAPEPTLDDLKWTVAMARLVFGPLMNIQVPPNLTPAGDRFEDGSQWKAMINSGINDWGGISPVTRDWVNPEAPWPHLQHLANITLDSGKVLVPRLAVYPEYMENAEVWLDNRILKWVYSAADGLGYARGDDWSPGLIAEDNCKTRLVRDLDGTFKSSDYNHQKGRSSDVLKVLNEAVSLEELSEADIAILFGAIGEDMKEICLLADDLRCQMNGDTVTYVVNRNINYTNICKYSCRFCAFSKGQANDGLRGKPYVMTLDEISRRAAEAWDRGATEICMQGGIHPDYSGQTYLDILNAVKTAAPKIHVHAFSPLEVFQGASTLDVSVVSFLAMLKEAGLGSLPGTAAEILDKDVRNILCADKVTTEQWLKVMEMAHNLGLRSTATIMFGHIDRPKHWARHLIQIRELQKQTGGFTEFVPLPFVHMEAPLYLRGQARRGPTKRECILMHAVSRIVLHPYITNIQASWVKMGPSAAQSLLTVGCNDMGGSLMNESITRAAGASHGQELHPAEMEKLIKSIGRKSQQRTTLYGIAPSEQAIKSLSVEPLSI